MKVALRVDASTEIGIGPLRRCLALAQALRAQGAECHFVVRAPELESALQVRRAGFGLSGLSAQGSGVRAQPGAPLGLAAWNSVPPAADAAQTAAALGGHGWDWLVVDHPVFAAEWQHAARQALGVRLLAIDDLAERDHEVDILVDHNPARDHRAKFGAHLRRSALLLGGPRHALVGVAYAEAARHRVGGLVQSIGIYFGAVDRHGASLAALQALSTLGFRGDVEVALTSACPHLGALRARAAARPRTVLRLDPPDLAEFYARHGLQIGAGGSVTWERCCIGSPTLACVASDNQRPVLEALAKLGVLEACPTPSADEMAAPLQRLLRDAALRRRMSAAALKLVDGQGAARVAAAMLER